MIKIEDVTERGLSSKGQKCLMRFGIERNINSISKCEAVELCMDIQDTINRCARCKQLHLCWRLLGLKAEWEYLRQILESLEYHASR